MDEADDERLVVGCMTGTSIDALDAEIQARVVERALPLGV